MTGTIRRTIEELVGLGTHLPTLCNVVGRIKDAPKLVGGQKWVFKLEGLSGTAVALVAVHENPPPELHLGYNDTAPELLAIFADKNLAAGLAPGELVLVQGVPKSGQDGLWINVQAILVVRPNRLFGRAQIDYSSDCPRRSYLAVVKGIRGARRGGLNQGSVAGHVVHDLFSAWATGRASLHSDEEWSVGPSTLMDLVYLGIRSGDELSRALRAADRLRETVKSDPSLQDVIHQGPWLAEATVLNNGVAASPDLLRDGAVVELKHIAKGSPHDHPSSQRAQLESYLAWSMVEFGVPVVAGNWNALLVRLHPSTPQSERVESLRPTPAMVAKRVLRRHRLLTLSQGRWLPRPGTECNYCEYGDRRDVDALGSAPACEFYCQTERAWACRDENAACPLINRCDQRHRWFDFSLLDQVNLHRRILASEEEERETVATVVEALASGAAAGESGLDIGPFSVIDANRGTLRLQLPATALNFDFAVAGDLFEFVHAGESAGIVEFVKRRDDAIVLTLARRGFTSPPAGASVSLRVIPKWEVEPRDLLSFLDARQRASGFVSLKADIAHVPQLRKVTKLAEGGQFADLTIVDTCGTRGSREALAEVVEAASRLGVGRTVLVDPAKVGAAPPAGSEWLDEVGVASELEKGTAPIEAKVEAICARIRQAQWWCVPQEEILGVRLSSVVETLGKVPLLVVVGAESLPLLAVSRCFELADRVVLIGQSSASGPKAEDLQARQSDLFQNPLGFILAGALHVLPPRVAIVESLERIPETSLHGTDRLGLKVGRHTVPLEWTEVPGERTQRWQESGPIVLEVSIPTVSGTVKDLRLKVHHRESVGASTIRVLLRGISAARVEAVQSAHVGSVDRGILGHPVIIQSVASRIRGSERPGHTVQVEIPVENLRFVQERCYSSRAEVDAITKYVGEHRREEFVVTSPFFAQCAQLAEKLSAAGAPNARVTPLEQLGRKSVGLQNRSLLLSWVVGAAEFTYPAPLDDLGRLQELIYGDWSSVRIFASPDAMLHHPFLRALRSKNLPSGSTPHAP